jgi:peptidoglycan/xylan/chitin deacetylase (PgdA/CDA1 family)
VDSIAASLGYSIYMWDIDPRDWAGTSVSYITSTILNNAHPGAVVILHMHAYNTMAALPGIIEGLQDAGYVLSY